MNGRDHESAPHPTVARVPKCMIPAPAGSVPLTPSRSGGGVPRPVGDAEVQKMAEYVSRKLPEVTGYRWNPGFFEGDAGMRVIFRKLDGGEKEHWLNTAAVMITSNPWDYPPYSNNCHAELAIDVDRGRTVRIGTMYQYSTQNEETGEKEWHPGSVFVAPIDEGEMKKYESWKLVGATRVSQLRAVCFALRNYGAPFHVSAYRLRAVAPRTHGVGYYDPVQNDVSKTDPVGEWYFCTQFVVLCVQAAAYELLRGGHAENTEQKSWMSIKGSHATEFTPNSLYKYIRSCYDVKLAFQPMAKLSLN